MVAWLDAVASGGSHPREPRRSSARGSQRVLALVPWILAHPGVTLAELATRFEVSERELERDLELLPMCGLPPYTADRLIDVSVIDGAVEIRLAEYFERPLRLTPAEGLALLAAGRALLAVPGSDTDGPLATALGEARRRARRARAARGRRRRERPSRTTAGRDRVRRAGRDRLLLVRARRDDDTRRRSVARVPCVRRLVPRRRGATAPKASACSASTASARCAPPASTSIPTPRGRTTTRTRDLVYRPRPDDPRVDAAARARGRRGWSRAIPHESATPAQGRLVARSCSRSASRRGSNGSCSASGPTPPSWRRPSSSTSASARRGARSAPGTSGPGADRPGRPRPVPARRDREDGRRGASSVTDERRRPHRRRAAADSRRPPPPPPATAPAAREPGHDPTTPRPRRRQAQHRTAPSLEWGGPHRRRDRHRARHQDVPVPGLLHPVGVDGADARGRRPRARQQAELRPPRRHRGDIVVFEAEPNAEWRRAGIDDLVKRVIALPGETITQCETNRVVHRRAPARRELPARRARSPICPRLDRHRQHRGSRPRLRRPTVPTAAARCRRASLRDGRQPHQSHDARANGPIKESSIVGRVFVRIWPPGRIGFM